MLKNFAWRAAVAVGALSSGHSAAGQAPVMDQSQFTRMVDACLAANTRTEFDTPNDVLTRVKPTCAITGAVRFAARGHPILGDLLRYDPDRTRFIWNVALDEQNRFYGGGASPYTLAVRPDAVGRPVSPSNPPEIAAILREVGNANFWLLPLFRTGAVRDTYHASNAYGAAREVVRVKEARYGLAAHIPANLFSLLVLEVPADSATAREIADHLDLILTFRVGEVCRICFKSGTLERGTRPTVAVPLEEEVTTKFVYVEVLDIQVVDRRTGRVLPARLSPPS